MWWGKRVSSVTGCWMLDTGCWILDIVRKKINAIMQKSNILCATLFLSAFVAEKQTLQ
jgi:hypothetical protein